MKTTGTEPDIPVLYEDNHLLVVAKPSGLLSQEDYTGEPDLLTLCREYIKNEYNKPGNVFLGLLHRLDKPVSGVMVFAKTSKAASRISDQIRKREVRKLYMAVVKGTPPENGFLEHHLEKDTRRNLVQAVDKPTKNSKPARLSFQKIAQQNNLALIEVNLITGRAHQIRVQFAESGTPVYGDQKYGEGKKAQIALHAHKFELEHPTKKEKISFTAPLPENHPWSLF